MANSEYQYVRSFETYDALPPSNWIVIRIDGRGFSKLCKRYHFTKPNDKRALDLMNAAAVEVVRSFHDIVLAYGQSDEYSFVFAEDTSLFERRRAKLETSVATQFTAEYCMLWPEFFENVKLERPWPTFDARAVAYPKRKILRDYLKWRQVDCHINNLYNTTFWNMVKQGGMSGTEAEEELKGSLAADKNEILWSRFGINYNKEPEIFKKGSVVYRDFGEDEIGKDDVVKVAADPKSKTQLEKERKRKQKARVVVDHLDIIGDGFWEKRSWILDPRGKDGQDE